MSVHLVTLASHEDGWFKALQSSCARHGFHLHVLGWGEPWGGFMQKIRLVDQFLRDSVWYDANDLFVVADAYDVLVLQDATELVRRIDTLTDNNRCRRVVLGIEGRRADPLDALISQWRFGRCNQRHVVNAGVYIGCARRLCDFFELLGVDRWPDATDDQKLINATCRRDVTRFRDLVVFDEQKWIIYNDMSSSTSLNLLTRRGTAHGLQLCSLKNPDTGEVPCIVHVPTVPCNVEVTGDPSARLI